ncbi:delta-60 repeat domain-containing protein [Flavobacterium sp.]|nr:delta-60 repeat domain-containing protein [Flavobacterium sp.]MDD2986128.1 delta-60 repeat domain-containing protein [Flavobacterium sp.]
MNYNGVTKNRIARLNQDGTLDTTFISGVGTNNEIRSIALFSNGTIILG